MNVLSLLPIFGKRFLPKRTPSQVAISLSEFFIQHVFECALGKDEREQILLVFRYDPERGTVQCHTTTDRDEGGVGYQIALVLISNWNAFLEVLSQRFFRNPRIFPDQDYPRVSVWYTRYGREGENSNVCECRIQRVAPPIADPPTREQQRAS